MNRSETDERRHRIGTGAREGLTGTTEVPADRGARRTAWLLLAAAALVNTAGYLFHLWDRPVWFDEVVHGATLGAITYALAVDASSRVLHGAGWHPVRWVVLLTLAGLGAGALWEVAEWAYDEFYAPGNAILGKWDTITDLIADATGALAASVAVTAAARRKLRRRSAGTARAT